jgi:hypothetical protein
VRLVDLMEKLQLTSNEGRLQLDPKLHLADKFAKQLQEAINVKHTAAGWLTFGAPQAVHDDLVAAVGIGVRYMVAAGEPRRYGTEVAPALDPFRSGQKLVGPAIEGNEALPEPDYPKGGSVPRYRPPAGCSRGDEDRGGKRWRGGAKPPHLDLTA